MSSVITDYEEMRAFAKRIEDYVRDAEAEIARLRAHLEQMGSTTWQDKKYEEFKGMFESQMTLIQRVLAEVGQHPEYLRRKAVLLEEYFGR